jgi:ankyrin repeat protein
MSILGTYSKSKGVKLNSTTLLTEVLPSEAIESSKILQDACAAKCIEGFNAALAKITHIDFQDPEGRTILMHAIINGFHYGVDKLLQMGANVNIVDHKGVLNTNPRR